MPISECMESICTRNALKGISAIGNVSKATINAPSNIERYAETVITATDFFLILTD